MHEDSLHASIGRFRQLIDTLYELSSLLNTDQIHEFVVNAGIKLTGSTDAWLLLLDQINEKLNLETGIFSSSIDHQDLVIPVNSSVEGWVIANQQSIIVNDTGSYDKNLGELINLPGLTIESLLIVPLWTRDRRIGVLEVANKQHGDYSLLDQEIIGSLANQAAISIDNSHRFLQSDLVAEFVHEIRTPLAALVTANRLLERDDLLKDKKTQVHQMIQKEFDRLTELTTAFLDYARLESGRMKFTPSRFDLNQLINECAEVMKLHAAGKGLTLTAELAGEKIPVTADKDKIKQVILNLLNNAIIYGKVGGKIRINSRSAPTEVSFCIQDDGEEIPPEYLMRLFERFYRIPTVENEATGSGLGLTICKQIVEAHKGRIEVTSSQQAGTSFVVHLPAG